MMIKLKPEILCSCQSDCKYILHSTFYDSRMPTNSKDCAVDHVTTSTLLRKMDSLWACSVTPHSYQNHFSNILPPTLDPHIVSSFRYRQTITVSNLNPHVCYMFRQLHLRLSSSPCKYAAKSTSCEIPFHSARSSSCHLLQHSHTHCAWRTAVCIFTQFDTHTNVASWVKCQCS
jgi:hypothetical protein